MKKHQILSLISAVLVLLISWKVCADELTPSGNNFQLFPPDLPSDLKLPPCEWNEDKTTCSRTIEQEKTVLSIYLGYSIAMKHRPKIENILTVDAKILELNEQMYHIAMTTIDDQSAYTEHLIGRLETYESKVQQARKKDIINNIIWGTAGAGVGALIVGIIVLSAR